MFEKLKKKLKQVKERIIRKVPAEEVPEAMDETKEAPKEVQSSPTPAVSQTEPEPPSVVQPKLQRARPTKGLRRVVKKISRRELSPEDVEDILWDLQVGLLESDVAVPVADKIIERVKTELIGKKLGLREDPKKLADEVLRKAIEEVLTPEKKLDLIKIIEEKRIRGEPAVLVFVGINGTGKTTTVAKVARYLMGRGYKVVLAAADTFRAAGIEQLETHAERIGAEVVKQRRGADAAAVAYDAIAHAKARGIDVVLVDTAGRMQTEANLMDEMRKIVRVANPDVVVFVGDALTGNDAVEQAKTFDDAVHISGSILCKMDADARGGAALSISQVTGKPILFLGTGQGYEDLVEFKPDIILNALFGD
ncbi:MAG: signal recognition particle-docking protein FtsY [Hadesarchaea archaeon]|nr:MAG: signal recognition particle-docking protein FtsY [Hadesarchaea archaeon]